MRTLVAKAQRHKIEKRIQMSFRIEVSLARTISANHLRRNECLYHELLLSCIHPEGRFNFFQSLQTRSTQSGLFPAIAQSGRS